MINNSIGGKLTDSFDVRAALASKTVQRGASLNTPTQMGDSEMLPMDLEQTEDSTQYETVVPVPQVEIEKMVGHRINKVSVPVIKDTTGRLSDVLDAVCVPLGVNVIPFKIVEFPSAIVELQRYDVDSIGTAKFAVSRDIRADVINDYTERIMEAIQSGNSFVESLWVEVFHNGISARTLRLSKYELSYLSASFADFNPQIKKDSVTGDILFEVRLL